MDSASHIGDGIAEDMAVDDHHWQLGSSGGVAQQGNQCQSQAADDFDHRVGCDTGPNVELPVGAPSSLGGPADLGDRLSSANDRYNEGRNLWSDLILGCRRWSTTVWLSCECSPPAVERICVPVLIRSRSGPDTLDKDEGDDSDEEDEDHKPPSKTDTLTDEKEARALIEKTTMTRMALAYAVAVKHFLRGEEGM